MLRKNSANTFYCFSPFVMALTFVVEALLLAYVVVKSGAKSLELRLLISLIFFLALFQLSEYGVCEDLFMDSQTWGKIGFVSIALLPALGLHLVQTIRRDRSIAQSYIGYGLAALFSFAFVGFNAFESIGCLGNYAIFEFNSDLGIAFAIYYYALLGAATVLAFQGWRHIRRKKDKQALMSIILGYASFALPGSFIHFVINTPGNGLPSIMCGFALIFAFVLALYTAPKVSKT